MESVEAAVPAACLKCGRRARRYSGIISARSAAFLAELLESGIVTQTIPERIMINSASSRTFSLTGGTKSAL